MSAKEEKPCGNEEGLKDGGGSGIKQIEVHVLAVTVVALGQVLYYFSALDRHA